MPIQVGVGAIVDYLCEPDSLDDDAPAGPITWDAGVLWDDTTEWI